MAFSSSRALACLMASASSLSFRNILPANERKMVKSDCSQRSQNLPCPAPGWRYTAQGHRCAATEGLHYHNKPTLCPQGTRLPPAQRRKHQVRAALCNSSVWAAPGKAGQVSSAGPCTKIKLSRHYSPRCIEKHQRRKGLHLTLHLSLALLPPRSDAFCPSPPRAGTSHAYQAMCQAHSQTQGAAPRARCSLQDPDSCTHLPHNNLLSACGQRGSSSLTQANAAKGLLPWEPHQARVGTSAPHTLK